jgi:hypothetical protein
MLSVPPTEMKLPIIVLPAYESLVRDTTDLMIQFGLGLNDLKCGFLTKNELVYIIREVLYLKNGNSCYYTGLLSAKKKHLLVFLVSLLRDKKKTGALMSLLFYIIGKDSWIASKKPQKVNVDEYVVAKYRTAIKERTVLHELFFELAAALDYTQPKESRQCPFWFGKEPLTFSKLSSHRFRLRDGTLCIVNDPYHVVDVLLGTKQHEVQEYLSRTPIAINHTLPSYVIADLAEFQNRRATIDDPNGEAFYDAVKSSLLSMKQHTLPLNDEKVQSDALKHIETASGTICMTSPNHRREG